jgi:hypothetical protein
MKNLLFRGITILMSLLVGLLIAEVALRLFPSLISMPLLSNFPAQLRHHVADRLNYANVNGYVIPTKQRTDRGPPIYLPAPNSTGRTPLDPADLAAGATETVRMDAKGFCNPPAKAERPSVDVVVLGDSFVYCTGVEATDTSTSYLEDISHLTTYSLGFGGKGPYEYVELLRHFGLALKPRVVIFNIYEGNDLRDAISYQKFLQTGRDRRATQNAIQDALSFSYALSLIYASSHWLFHDQIRWLLDSDRAIDYRYTARSQGSLIELNVSNRSRGQVRIAKNLKEGEVGLELWAAPLAAFKELAVSHGFIGIVSYTPSMHTAYADTAVFEDPTSGEFVHAMSQMQRDWLSKKSAELGLIYIDLTPAFQKAAHEGPLTHFPVNVHLTAYGHRVSATEWASIIAKALGATATRGPQSTASPKP